jgi:hypothetical protein
MRANPQDLANGICDLHPAQLQARQGGRQRTAGQLHGVLEAGTGVQTQRLEASACRGAKGDGGYRSKHSMLQHPEERLAAVLQSTQECDLGARHTMNPSIERVCTGSTQLCTAAGSTAALLVSEAAS